jgi:Ca-activated chloride channel family protein
MPRVCPQLLVVAAVAVAAPPAARGATLPDHMGMYVAKQGGKQPAKTEALAELPAVASSIHATATGPLIEVVTTQVFTNTSKHTIEAVYVFPLPPDAAVSAMTIRVGEKVIHAEIVPRDEAVQRHEAAVAAGVTGALFEQDRPDVFTQTITGIAAGATIEVELRWDTVATRRDGAWELVVPLVVAPRAVPGTPTGKGVVGSGTSPDTDRSPDASRVTPPVRDDGTGTETAFTLALDARASDVTSPSHELVVKSTSDGTIVKTTDPASARDLVVRWKTKARSRGWLERDDTEGFVALTVEAPPKKGKAKPVHVVIAIDDRGAAGESTVVGRRVERALVAALGKKDKYAVRTHGGSYEWQKVAGKLPARETPAAGDRHDLVVELGRLADAVKDGGRATEVVLVTDGLVADQSAVIAAAKQHGVPVHVIGVGAAPNRSLVLAIATATGGTARFVDAGADDAAATAKRVIADLAHPASAPVIDWGGLEVVDVHPAALPRLGAGQAITITARTTAPRTAKVKVDRSAAFAIEVESRPAAPEGATTPHGLIARIWARARLAELLDGGAAAGEVQRVALAYGLVSPYTAMIAVGEEVVERGGTTYSAAIPVAVPSGMRWQAKFDDKLERDASGRRGGIKQDETTQPTGGAIRAAEEDDNRTRLESEDKASIDRDVGDDDGDAISPSPPEPSIGSGAGGYAAGADAEGTISLSASESRRDGRGIYFGLRATGGLVLAEDTRRAMGAIAGRLAARLGPVEVGPDLSLWLVGEDRDVVGRTLLSATLTGLFDGWLDVGIGVGAHIGTDTGAGYAGSLRFGRGWLTPTLRWDGAVVRGDDGELHSAGAVNLGVEASF